MKIQIQLDKTNNIGSLVNSEPFLLVGNETLEIEFLCDDKSVLVANLKNGALQKQLLVYNGKFIVPVEFISVGEIEIIVSEYSDNLSRKWHCEPIKIIKPREDVFEGYSLIRELKKEISELKAKINVLEDETIDLKQHISRIWELQES
ncbi:MAG: hypothetical protein HFE29_02930 [Clostridia bacterium]|jgi:hypothetical protein|nr:hypothetical protein [Clostridia bacterium]